MTQDLEQRCQKAFTELQSTYDMMEAADMDMKPLRRWVRKWLDFKDGQAANDGPWLVGSACSTRATTQAAGKPKAKARGKGSR